MTETTTIRITKETQNELKEFGSMGDDYNKVIMKMIKVYKDYLYRQKIDKFAQETRQDFKEHRDEYVNIDEL